MLRHIVLVLWLALYCKRAAASHCCQPELSAILGTTRIRCGRRPLLLLNAALLRSLNTGTNNIFTGRQHSSSVQFANARGFRPHLLASSGCCKQLEGGM